jgi:hypothetical protein
MYLPWAGYFEQIASVDLFVLLDDVQYTKKDWRNRNRIKTTAGVRWLTVPTSGVASNTRIYDVDIDYGRNWINKHLRAVEANYRRRPGFEPFFDEFASVLNRRYEKLWQLDAELILLVTRYLGISTPFSRASAVPRDPERYSPGSDRRNERLIEICQHFGADVLYDGKSAANFIDLAYFESRSITVLFQDYTPSPYEQAFGDFVSHLSIIDLIMNTGPAAARILLEPRGAGSLLRERMGRASCATFS